MRALILGGIVLAAIGLRLWQIGVLPPGFHFDESFEGLEAWRILTDAAYRPVFLTGNFGVPPLNAYANAVTFALFRAAGLEIGPTAMRVTAACFGVLAVIAVYLLAGELRLLDPRRLTAFFPLLAAALLATLRWHIHFSRMGIEPILTPLIWAAATWLFLRGGRTGSWWSFGAAGVALAAGLYAYQAAWVIPVLLALTAGLLWWQRRRMDLRPPQGKGSAGLLAGTLATAAVMLVLALPLFWFFAGHRDLLLLRPSQIATGSAGDTGWGHNLLASILMFVPVGQTGDPDPRRNLPGAAALDWWQFLPFAAGILLALWRVRSPAYQILLLGLAGLLLPGVLSEYAPHFHRVLGAAAPAALLAAVGLDSLIWAAARCDVQRVRWSNWGIWVSGLLVAAGAVVGIQEYFVRWAQLPDLFAAFDVGLWEIGRDLGRRPPAEPYYLTPRAASHPTVAFALSTLGPDAAPPVSFDGRHIFPVTAGASVHPETYIAIEAEDFRTRLLLPEVLPQAAPVKEIYDGQGQVYARYYRRPAGAVDDRPPHHSVDAVLGDGITLSGYDVQPASLHPGDILYLQLHWRVDATPATGWTVFTHLLQPDGQGGWKVVAGQDSVPGAGSLPTTAWQPGWRVLDEYQLALPTDLPPGVYRLAAGLYTPAGKQLGGAGPGILLGEVHIDRGG